MRSRNCAAACAASSGSIRSATGPAMGAPARACRRRCRTWTCWRRERIWRASERCCLDTARHSDEGGRRMGCILKGNSGVYSCMTVGAVLLAAGAGSRLGGRPKALLELGGVPLVLRQLIALSGAGVDEVVVVLGHHADAIEAVVRPFPITLAHNPRPDDGQASSVRIGLQALSPKLDAGMVALADQPPVDGQDITALIGAFTKPGERGMA